ncbi:hypothetical protein [uncultured Campylobacter sp.]|uniref:hypothetical protein n=1 Tax=uncultured Campylobacter sp. TaxID=218934 RepID=UPI0026217C02|nr:hypothetical protein [uncultured Campylobacter sp.]
MRHAFNTDLAEKYGIEKALIIDYFAYWVVENMRNERNFHEGRYWVFNSASALSEKFHYISRRTMNQKLQELEADGILISGNFNKNKFDRTKWYSFKDEYAWLLDEHRSSAEIAASSGDNLQSIGESSHSIGENCQWSGENCHSIKISNTYTDKNSKEFQTDSSLSLANARTREAIPADDFSQSNIFSPPVQEPAKPKKFQKPTIEQIKAYCKEAGKDIDPEAFFDFYEAKGWVVGRAPMKDWKAAVRNWAKNESQFLRRKVGSDGQEVGSMGLPLSQVSEAGQVTMANATGLYEYYERQGR